VSNPLVAKFDILGIVVVALLVETVKKNIATKYKNDGWYGEGNDDRIVISFGPRTVGDLLLNNY